jgi:SUMO ligase MMS21 Smc5/6 complex component
VVDHGQTAEDQEAGESMLMVDLDELSCPISFQLMTDPVVATDGHTYQRDAIEAWIKKCITGKEPAHM